MDATLLASLTKNYPDATAWTSSAFTNSMSWYKLYNGGIITYSRSGKDVSVLGIYRVTVDGVNWGTFPQVNQSVYSQPNPAEISARDWIDAWNTAHPSAVEVGGSTIIGGSTTINTPSGVNWYMVGGILAVVVVLIIVFYPRRKTIFDRRRR